MSCTTNALSSRLTCYTAARTSHRSSALYRVSEPQLNLANTVWAYATADEQRMKDQGVQPNVISLRALVVIIESARVGSSMLRMVAAHTLRALATDTDNLKVAHVLGAVEILIQMTHRSTDFKDVE